MSRLSGFVPASSCKAIEASEQMESAGVLSNSSEAFSGAALGRQVDTVSKRISSVLRQVFVKCGLMAAIRFESDRSKFSLISGVGPRWELWFGMFNSKAMVIACW